jgi:hypothetical protein
MQWNFGFRKNVGNSLSGWAAVGFSGGTGSMELVS